MPISEASLYAANLKCIGAERQGLSNIELINIIIGRNNSGKSSLLDLVEIATHESIKDDASLRHKNSAPPEILLEFPVTAALIERFFPSNISGGTLTGRNHLEFGIATFRDTRMTAQVLNGTTRSVREIRNPTQPIRDFSAESNQAAQYLNSIANVKEVNPFYKKEFRRILAERNISPEVDTPNITIQGNGTGVTTAIQQFLNKAHLDRDLVRIRLLNDLNVIFGPDSIFEEIICRQLIGGAWEIFLREKEKGLISLSNSGSGLKTVIIVLCFIHLAPALVNKPLGEFLFAFEELENNLHPALQRRLLSFLAKRSVEENFPLFLTTHSNVAIDLFNKHPDAQILHVTHNGSNSIIRPVKAFIERQGVLDDLDVRASDLLQSNGVIWLEGPSDRVYLNHWINLISYGELSEGNHYQCVFYGGRLLSHLSAQGIDETESSGVSILRVNRNACIIIDSDKKDAGTPINETKQRIVREIESIGGMAWVTDGREIENYIPFSTLQAWAISGKFKSPPKPFDSFFRYLDRAEADLGKRFEAKKPMLAEQINQYTKRTDLEADEKLFGRLTQLCERIRSWNRMPEPAPPKAEA